VKLETLRKKINAVDAKIIRLLAARQALTLAVGAYKKKHNLPIRHPDREAEILKKSRAMALESGLSILLVRNIFKEIFKVSKRIQRKL